MTMNDQSMPYPVIGQFATGRKIRVKIDDQWIEAPVVLAEKNLIWGDNEIDISERDDISEVDVNVIVEVDVTDFLQQVGIEHKPGVDGMQTIDTQLGVMVRWINRSLRKRQAKIAPVVSLEDRGTGKSRRRILSAECRDIRVKRSDIDGRILFQPLIFAKRDLRIFPKMVWSGGPQKIGRGSSVGWGTPLELIVNRRVGDLGSIFRFVWQNFEESDPKHSDLVFKVEWSVEPTIFLNRGIGELEQVLLNTSNAGRTAAVRDSTNAMIATQALTIASISALRECEKILRSEEFSTDGVISELSPQNHLFFEAFGFLFLPLASTKFAVSDVIESIQTSDFDADLFLSDELPIRIQEFLSLGTKTMKLLTLLDGQGRQND